MAQRSAVTGLDVAPAALVSASLAAAALLIAPISPESVTVRGEPLPFIEEVADSAIDPNLPSAPQTGLYFGSPSPADGASLPAPSPGSVATPVDGQAPFGIAETTTNTPPTTDGFASSSAETNQSETSIATAPSSTAPALTTPSSTTSNSSSTTTGAPTPSGSAPSSSTQASSTSAAPTISTPATDSPGAVVRILATGDIGQCNDDAPQQVGDLAATLEGQLIAVGDIAYPDGTLSEIQNCFARPYQAVLDRVIPVAGNHEYGTAYAAGWKEFFGRTDTYYSTQLGSWKLIVLDTECNMIGGCGASDPQQQWLQSQLSTAPLCTVVAMHRPYRVSSSNYDRQYRSAEIHQILLEADVDVILTGHEHIYEHLKFGNSHQFVVGTGGAGLRSAGSPIAESQNIVEGHHGLAALDLASGSFSWRFIDIAGNTHDSGSSSCA